MAAPVLAAATPVDMGSLVWVLLASSLGALLSRFHNRVVLPTVVLEIVLGILIGPEGLGLAEVDGYIRFLANTGLAFLFFFAGLEVVEKNVPRASLVRGSAGWAISIAIGLAVGVGLEQAGLDAEWWVVGVAVATTALGALVPIVGDAGLLGTPFGSAVLGTGVAGEFWPIVVISVFLTGVYGAGEEVLLLLGFGALVTLAAATALRARPPRVVRVLQETLHTTGQTAVRLSTLVLAALILLSIDVGFDFVLGAFAAGLIVGLGLKSGHGEAVQMRLEGIGFGFVIPIYFVTTGMTFDLDSLLSPTGLGLAGLFLALFVLARGASALLWRRRLEPRATAALALLGATGLPLIVAIVGIGTERGALAGDVGASLIGAGMVSVLLFPLVAIRLVREAVPAAPPAGLEVSEEY